MKKNITILFVILTVGISSVLFSTQTKAQQSNVNFQVFYDQLSPYGQWIDNATYGYVWIPSAGNDFIPYSTAGYWMYTEYGWTWYSEYNWGWAPFHYGRWDFNNHYGWYWIPDNEWGPSWVIWRSSAGYYGWTPMRPGVNINIAFSNGYNSNNDYWIFVRNRDIGRSNIHRYRVSKRDQENVFRNSKMINNTYNDRKRNTKYISGPGIDDVQRATGKKVRVVGVQDNDNPGQAYHKGQLNIYRPNVNKGNKSHQRVAPSRVSNLNDVKKPSGRNSNNRQKNATHSKNNQNQKQPKKSKPNKRND
jgi:hypothetical protein